MQKCQVSWVNCFSNAKCCMPHGRLGKPDRCKQTFVHLHMRLPASCLPRMQTLGVGSSANSLQMACKYASKTSAFCWQFFSSMEKIGEKYAAKSCKNIVRRFFDKKQTQNGNKHSTLTTSKWSFVCRYFSHFFSKLQLFTHSVQWTASCSCMQLTANLFVHIFWGAPWREYKAACVCGNICSTAIGTDSCNAQEEWIGGYEEWAKVAWFFPSICTSCFYVACSMVYFLLFSKLEKF